MQSKLEFVKILLMDFLEKILPTIQVVVSILLIISILLQQTGSELGAGFGGGSSSSSVISTRRGLEKTLLKVSITLAVLFLITAILALYLSKIS